MCVSVPFGRRLFWESLPELLLVLMLCDNNLSCLLLVYAGHEKALCAARGAGCQLGSVRLSLCAPRLQPLSKTPHGRLGGAHGQRLAPQKRGHSCCSSWAPPALHTCGWWERWGAQGNVSTQRKHFQLLVPSSSGLFEWDPKLKEVSGTDVIRDCHQIC